MMSLDRLLMLAPMFLIAITFHEYAHGWMADRLGDPGPRRAGRLSFNPLRHLDPIGTLMLVFIGIGFAKPVMVEPGRFREPVRDMMRVALAGPVANIILALVFAILFRSIGLNLGGVGAEFLFWGVWLNVALAFFNLLPFPPLDGSRILRAFVGPSGRMILAQIEPYGFILVIVFAYLGLLGSLVFGPTTAVVRMLVGG